MKLIDFFTKIWKDLKHYVHLCAIDIFRLFVFKHGYTCLNIDPKREVIATVMSCLNNLEYTKKAIDSYYASFDSKDYKTKEFFLSEGKKYKNICYFRYGKNVGLTQTWNDGVHFALKKLKADYMFLINNDVIIPEGTLNRLIAHIRNNRKIGVIGPLTNSPGDQLLQDIRRYSEAYAASDSMDDIQKTADLVRDNKPIEIDHVNGFFMGFPKETFTRNIYFTLFRTYYFNPVFRNVKNESRFQARLKSTGLKNFLSADSFVFHYKDVSQHRTEDLSDRLKRGEIFRES